MKCPNCNSNIIDNAVICPVCNTQFAFNAPSSYNANNSSNLYEEIEVLEEEVPLNSVTTLPSEVNNIGEEEVNPNEMTYTVASNNTEEYMHINGQPIAVDNVPFDQDVSPVATPIRPETPRINTSYASLAPVQNPGPAPASTPLTNTQVNSPVAETNIKENQTASTINNNNSIPIVSPVGTNTVVIDNSQEENPESLDELRRKSDIFFKVVISVGTLVFMFLLGFLLLGDKYNPKGEPLKQITTTKTVQTSIVSANQGHRTTFNYPLNVGDTTVASIYDAEANIYTDVDVKAERFITGKEALELATNNVTSSLNLGFEWEGLEYTVTFNDLTYLNNRSISPILKSTIYKWNGFDFVKYQSKNYFLEVSSIYDGGNITNKSSAKIKVIYQIPIGEKEYSICFGTIEQTLGCFSKF